MEKQEREREEKEKQEKERQEKEWQEKENGEGERQERENKAWEKQEKERRERERKEEEARRKYLPQLCSQSWGEVEKETLENCAIHQGPIEDPLSLPCLHACCAGCLQDLIRKNKPRQCPVCRSSFEAEEDSIRTAFKPVYFTERLAASLSLSDPNQSQLCVCQEKDATSYCSDCEIFLCDSCKRAHLKARITANHQVVSIKEHFEQGGGGKRKSYCTEHPAFELNTYCKQCDAVICPTCSAKYHGSHPVELLENQVKSIKEEIQNYWAKGKVMEEKLERGIEEATKRLNTLEGNMTKAEKEILETLEDIVKQAESRKEKLLEELKKKGAGVRKNLKMQKDGLELDKAAVGGVIEYSKALYFEATDVEAAASKNVVKARMSTLEEVVIEPEIQGNPSLRFDASDKKALLNALASFGKIVQ